MSQFPPKLSGLPTQGQHSFLLKFILLGVLWLALLIPLAQLRSVVEERTRFADGAVEEIGRSWGGPQLVAGPFLRVPLRRTKVVNEKTTQTTTEWLTFLPENLAVDGSVATEIRHRGIFEAAVYRGDLRVKGTFLRPDPGAVVTLDRAEVLWQEAVLAFAVSDLRGLRSKLELDWNGSKLPLAPLSLGQIEMPTLGVKVPLDPPNGGLFHFSLAVGLNGSGQLSFLPIGKETLVTLASAWRTPSFSGAFLPDQRNIDHQGFRASWSIPFFARSFPQAFGSSFEMSHLFETSFGVDLLLPVDTYQKSDRSLKYGGLFVLLTFLTFLLFEIFEGRRLHAIQYLLVGFAMSIFYLLLLSLGEHLPFRIAYVIAAVAVTLLISGYARAILGSRRGSVGLLVVLTLLYSFLCVLLESEDYALLVGSLALFGVLSLVMYLTRHIDWSGGGPLPESRPDENEEAEAAT